MCLGRVGVCFVVVVFMWMFRLLVFCSCWMM